MLDVLHSTEGSMMSPSWLLGGPKGVPPYKHDRRIGHKSNQQYPDKSMVLVKPKTIWGDDEDTNQGHATEWESAE